MPQVATLPCNLQHVPAGTFFEPTVHAACVRAHTIVLVHISTTVIVQDSSDDCLHLLEEAVDAQDSAAHNHISQNLLSSLFGDSLQLSEGVAAVSAAPPLASALHASQCVASDALSECARSDSQRTDAMRNGVAQDSALNHEQQGRDASLQQDGLCQHAATRNGRTQNMSASTALDAASRALSHALTWHGGPSQRSDSITDGQVHRSGSTLLHDGVKRDGSGLLHNGYAADSVSIWAHASVGTDGAQPQPRISGHTGRAGQQAEQDDIHADPVVAMGRNGKHSASRGHEQAPAEYSIWSSHHALPLSLLPELATGYADQEAQMNSQMCSPSQCNAASKLIPAVAASDGASLSAWQDVHMCSRAQSEASHAHTSVHASAGDVRASTGTADWGSGTQATATGGRPVSCEHELVSEADAMLMLRKLLSRTFNAGSGGSEPQRHAAMQTTAGAQGVQSSAAEQVSHHLHSRSASGAHLHHASPALADVKPAPEHGRQMSGKAIPQLQLTQQQMQALTALVQGRSETNSAPLAAPAAEQNTSNSGTSAGTSEAAVTNILARLLGSHDPQHASAAHMPAQGYAPPPQHVSAALSAALQRIASSAQADQQSWHGHAHSVSSSAAAFGASPPAGTQPASVPTGHSGYQYANGCGELARPAHSSAQPHQVHTGHQAAHGSYAGPAATYSTAPTASVPPPPLPGQVRSS